MEIRKILNVNVASAGGCGGGGVSASSDSVDFSASKISAKLKTMIDEANAAYEGFTGVTKKVDEALGKGGVLYGAVADIQTDWQAFQAEYKAFIDQMERVKKAVESAGGSYDTFNSNLATSFTKGAVGSAVNTAVSGASSATSGFYSTTQ